MHYVYVIKSLAADNQLYIGHTLNIKSRLLMHNSGKALHTAKYMPWELLTYFVFKNEIKAISFEKYLKTSSGRAFMFKRLI